MQCNKKYLVAKEKKISSFLISRNNLLKNTLAKLSEFFLLHILAFQNILDICNFFPYLLTFSQRTRVPPPLADISGKNVIFFTTPLIKVSFRSFSQQQFQFPKSQNWKLSNFKVLVAKPKRHIYLDSCFIVIESVADQSTHSYGNTADLI